MKALPFKVVKLESESFIIQREKQAFFYDSLHTHPEMQITSIISGSGTLISGNALTPFQAGDTYLIGSGLPHVFKSDTEYLSPGTNLVSESVSLYLKPDVLVPGFLDLPEMASVRFLISSGVNGLKFDRTTSVQILEKLLILIDSEGVDRIKNMLDTLIIAAKNHQKASSLSSGFDFQVNNEPEGERLEKIYRYTLEKYKNQIHLNELAELANMTVNSFCRYFKSRTQKSYITFLNSVRVDHACKKLKNRDLSVTEVAFESGFNNITNFNRIFKRFTGLTPGAYRRAFINGKIL